MSSSTLVLAQDANNASVEKGSPINSRALTEAEIQFLNFGDRAIVADIAGDEYPEYSSNIFQALEDSVAAQSDSGPLRLLLTIKPDLVRSTSYADLAANAVARKDEVKQALAGTSTSVLQDFENLPILLVEVDSQSVSTLSSIDAIGGVELDRQVQPHHNSTIPVIGARDLQLHSTTGAGFSGGGGGWDVAILDTGLRTSHAAVAGRVASEACFVSDNSCPNGTNTMVGAGASSDCGSYGGRCFHGTHVTGTSVGEFTDTGLLSFDGVAPDSKVHSIQIFNSAGSAAYFSDIVRGLQRVNNLVLGGARIASANMSLGGGAYSGNCDYASPSLATVSSTLRSNGVMVIASAGNGYSTSTMGLPACLTSVVAVGNTNDNDTVSSSSSTSNQMALWAPGNNVTSASEFSDTALDTLTGTSMSAPHVAGATAMLRECFVRPGSSANSPLVDDAILQTILSTGVSVTDQRFGGTVTRPRLNLAGAAASLRPNDTFAQSTSIGFNNGSFLGMNTCATTQALEPNHFGSTTGSVWYSYVVPNNGYYTFDTCDSATTFDTVLAVYTGNTLPTLVPRGSNDDSCGLKSSVTYLATAGQKLHIAVSGFGAPYENGATGVFKLNWSYVPHMCNGLQATIVGSAAANVINGTPGNDVIVALGGNDTINGFGGNDTICAGSGNDVILGGDGNDWIKAGNGDDDVKGQLGNDTIFGDAGADILRGSQGDDTVDGGEGNDNLNGGWGNDFVKGGPDNDIIVGDLGADILRGSQGNDNLDGGEGNDNLNGGTGNDFLKGGPSNDILLGGDGSDILRGSKGDDWLDGGAGNDSLNGGVHNVRDVCIIETTDINAPVNCEDLR